MAYVRQCVKRITLIKHSFLATSGILFLLQTKAGAIYFYNSKGGRTDNIRLGVCNEIPAICGRDDKGLPVCLFVILCNVSTVALGASGATGAVASAVSGSDALWQDARSVLNARQYPKARTLFNEFLKKFQTDPRALEAQICIGICDYNQGAVPRAIDTWTRAVNMELLQKRRSPALLLGLEQLAAHWQNTFPRKHGDRGRA